MIKKTDQDSGDQKIREAMEIIEALGLPRQQRNERSALTLLSLLNLKPADLWQDAENPLIGITPMMGFFETYYGKRYAPNTRETVRRQTVHQFMQAALIVPNPDKPSRPTNSPKAVYQIEPSALKLLRGYGKRGWKKRLREYLHTVEPLNKLYARERDMERIPVTLANGKAIRLSPGGHNDLVKKILEDFCPIFTPGGRIVYVGDTGEKWAYFDAAILQKLGVKIEEHGKMPDVVVHHVAKNWLVLIEAVTSHGPVNPKRRQELKELFAGSKAGLVFVTAFHDRHKMMKYLDEISWETEVWVAESPTHLIHFNGERFLGPYEDGA
jgi:type II restriction enzyme